MTSEDRPSPRDPPDPADAARRQARYWNVQYRSDPAFFGRDASPFLAWTLAALRDRTVGPRWLELGSGYGRDLVALRDRGYFARGVEVSRVGTELARRSGLSVVRAPALRFLATLDSESTDVVFSNLFFNMEFSEEEHLRLFEAVRRVLVAGGYHAYSVRSVADRWYGRGKQAGPCTFDFAPNGPVLHFFSRQYVRRLRRDRFRCVRRWEGTEGEGGFPISVLYYLDQKPKARRATRGR